jgi:hypothetical protein
MTTTRAAIGFDGYCQRTQDRSRPPESTVKPKSATEILADHWEAYEENWKARIAREDAEKLNEQRQRRLREQAEASERRKQQELQQRRAQASFIEGQQNSIFDEMSLDENERALVWRRLIAADAEYDLERTKVFALQVVAERK